MSSTYSSFPFDLLPEASLLRRRTTQEGVDQLWCLVRKRWVVTQPEELVRQAFLAVVIREGYPAGLVKLERSLPRSANRLDFLVLDRAGLPWLLAEFKSPDVSHLTGVSQLADYARSVRAPWSLVTNGREAICIHLDYQRAFLGYHLGLPAYPHI